MNQYSTTPHHREQNYSVLNFFSIFLLILMIGIFVGSIVFDVTRYYNQIWGIIGGVILAYFTFFIANTFMIASWFMLFGIFISQQYGYWPATWTKNVFYGTISSSGGWFSPAELSLFNNVKYGVMGGFGLIILLSIILLIVLRAKENNDSGDYSYKTDGIRGRFIGCIIASSIGAVLAISIVGLFNII